MADQLSKAKCSIAPDATEHGWPEVWPGPGLAAVIPAYRPLTAVVNLVKTLNAAGCKTIIIVDDGSGPEYASIFEQTEVLADAVVLRHLSNCGKGAALKTAFRHISEQHTEIEGIVTMDADGQHLCRDVIAVANVFAEHPNAVILGTRRLGVGVPLRSRLGNRLTRAMFRLIAGRKISDTQTGLRAIPAGFLPSLLAIEANRYDFELEMLLKTRPAGIDVVETEIETVYLDGNVSSHFNPIVDSFLIYFSLFRFSLSALAAVIFDFLVFYMVLEAVNSVAAALAAGRVSAIVLNFALNRNFVFHSHTDLRPTLIRYLSLVAILAVLAYTLIDLFSAMLGVNVLVAKVMAECALFVLSYLVQRDLVFANRDD